MYIKGLFRQLCSSYSSRFVMGMILYLLVILVFPQFIHAFTSPTMVQTVANMSDFWVVRLGLNLLGYATIFVPAAILMRYFKSINFQEKGGHGIFSRVVKLCIYVVALVEQGGFVESLAFMTAHPNFIIHIMVLSICSATGQLFIFYTISVFGAVTFTIIMTLRQALAIFLSCIIYGHPVTPLGVVGVAVVFLAMFLRIYINQRKKALAAARKPNNQSL
ncbi:SLC35B2 [Acanthosepion pharaonis]|uniref:Adenosine 3'-phospho 5'-phosphosulfate transporter 1 n=1 Tax=Acanthosepion pharaonis TaxID=158019 RepID=A0A812D5Y4_ACAPH|nr:SLC35B2 [Sepia pharaonis]